MNGFVLSRDADADLQDIYTYSEDTWGAPQAVNYLAGLFDLFERICRHPFIGRTRPDLGGAIRSLPHGPHVVFYMPWQGGIAILRVLHASMDVEAVSGSAGSLPGMGGEPG